MSDLPPVAEDVLTQARAYTEDPAASEDPQALVAGLLMVIDLIEGDLAKVQGSYRRSLDARADLEMHNEGLARQVGFMERYRMRAARLGVEAEALLDAVKTRLDHETGDDATPSSFHEGFVDALTRIVAHPAAVRLRALLDDPPTPGHPGGDSE